ncbi:hypothetical protein [Photobacterium rosenbergii]|uniref:Cupin n=1 Tax=Photobacterium rosenbergii TaxID=294936 RepID=A0ABU3ZHV9_9GAMM|nr:hypothetical protein [Photobacterium rosenbergii]MDV5169710.1 hypothetical protein [Photobacterium rosenbergii]
MSIEAFLSCPLLKDIPNDIYMPSPYVRPCRPQDLSVVDLSEPIRLDNYSSNENLVIQRALLNAYELDLVFIPIRKKFLLKSTVIANEGELEIYFSPDKQVNMKAGDKIIIPKGIMHMSKIISDKCLYSVKHLEEI